MYINSFNTAQDAFETLYDAIIENGVEYIGTKAIFDIGFIIENPMDNKINTPWRKWNQEYADYEWEWYLSGDRSVESLEKRAKIWSKMYKPGDPDKKVNSNYGFQWQRNNQLDKIVEKLKVDPYTRQAVISIYDGKEIDDYEYDTPCTNTITFYQRPDMKRKLNMSVQMRSNHTTFGFTNDQYFFSKLQKMVADRLELEVGYYYHHAVNMHLYEYDFNKKSNWENINNVKYINQSDFDESIHDCSHEEFYSKLIITT